MRSVAVAPELVELLWPGGRLVSGRGKPSRGLELLCLPSTTRVRSLIPVLPSDVPVGVVDRRLSGRRGPHGALQRIAVTGLLRAGLVTRGSARVAHLVPGPGTGLTEFLCTQLQRDVVVAIHLGAPRANRKPVLELVDRDGRVVAFGKLGINGLTDRLVEAEATALTTLSTRVLPHVTHPEVIVRTVWQGHPLLLQTPLPVEHARQATAALVAAAAREVAGPTVCAPGRLSETVYFAGLGARVSSLPRGEVSELLHRALHLLGGGDTRFSFGSWHGDWTPWNMASVSGRLAVWDWERYDSPVPVGFDLLHHAFQSAVQRNPGGAPAHARDLLARAPHLLRWMDPAAARATTQLYVIEIATRYVGDGQAQAGGRLGEVLPWVAPVLTGNPAESISEHQVK